MDTFLVNTQRYSEPSEYADLIRAQAKSTFRILGVELAKVSPDETSKVPAIVGAAVRHIQERVQQDYGIDVDVVELELDLSDEALDQSGLNAQIKSTGEQLARLTEAHDQLEIELLTKPTDIFGLGEDPTEDRLSRLRVRIEELRVKLSDLEQKRLEEQRARPRSWPLLGPTARLAYGTKEPRAHEPPPQLPGV